MKPNIRIGGKKSTAVGAGHSADAVHAASRRWSIRIIALALCFSWCAHSAMPQTNKIIDHQEPVSDHYSLAAVKSYEVFDAGMDGYVFMLVRLKTGEHFPMLCRKTSRGIYPIPQTVFAETGKEHWSIMCEPHVRNQSALMLLKMSRVADNLFMADKKLKATAKVPLLPTPQ